MCGIVSFSGKSTFNKDKINLLMIWNSFERGKDSTGIYSPKNHLIKDTDDAIKFLNSNPFEEDTLLIAHVRAQTIGVKSVKNAHPFIEDNVVLCHNGTLKNHYALLRKYDLAYQDYNVDSHIICAIIAKEKNFKVLSEIDGGAAFVMTNKNNPNTLYVFRNSERPLYRGVLEEGMYISSIKESLEIIGCKSIKEFKENYLYTIIDGLIQGSSSKIVNKPYSSTPAYINANMKYSGVNLPDVNQFMNMFIKYNTYENYSPGADLTLTYDNEYKVVGFNLQNNTLEVLDDYNCKVDVRIYKFDRIGSYFSKDDTVICRKDLVLTSNKSKLIIPKDTMCYIEEDNNNGTMVVLNLETNLSYTVSKEFFRNLNSIEKQLRESQTESTDILNNLDFINQTNNVKTIEEDDLDIDDEEDDNNYFDLQINEGELVSSLENINLSSLNLIDFVKGFIPTDDEIEFKSKTIDLRQCIEETLDIYNITNDKVCQI